MHAHVSTEPQRGLGARARFQPASSWRRRALGYHVVVLLLAPLALASCTSTETPARSDVEPNPPSNRAAGPPDQAASAPGAAALLVDEGETARTALVWVNGMGCPLCATNVDQQLRRVRGVEAVKINLGTGIVSVSLDPKLTPPEAALAQAVRDSGFTLVRIQMPVPSGAAEAGGGS